MLGSPATRCLESYDRRNITTEESLNNKTSDRKNTATEWLDLMEIPEGKLFSRVVC